MDDDAPSSPSRVARSAAVCPSVGRRRLLTTDETGRARVTQKMRCDAMRCVSVRRGTTLIENRLRINHVRGSRGAVGAGCGWGDPIRRLDAAGASRVGGRRGRPRAFWFRVGRGLRARADYVRVDDTEFSGWDTLGIGLGGETSRAEFAGASRAVRVGGDAVVVGVAGGAGRFGRGGVRDVDWWIFERGRGGYAIRGFWRVSTVDDAVEICTHGDGECEFTRHGFQRPMMDTDTYDKMIATTYSRTGTTEYFVLYI